MHIFPDLQRLERRFGETLVVIGVHSAKFDTERVTQNLREAVVRYRLDHPVVNDAGLTIWRAYGARAWPTVALIDPEGKIVGGMSGEGIYAPLEREIARLVEEFGKKGLLDRTPPKWALEREKLKSGDLHYPGKIAATEDPPRLYIADSNHHRILVAEPTGRVLDVIGGPEPGLADGVFKTARFRWPQGLCVGAAFQPRSSGGSGPAGTSHAGSGAEAPSYLYVADTDNHAIRKIDLATRTVATIAGTGEQEWVRGGGPARETALNSPWDVALEGERLHIAMAGDHRLWALDLAPGTVRPFAGSGREDIVDGDRFAAAFAQPSGLWIDGGTLYVADSESSGVRTVGLALDGEVGTLVGEGLFEFGDVDGVGSKVRLQHPLAVLVCDGKVFVADTYNHKIKTVDLKTRAVATFLGSGKAGHADGTPAEFNEPSGLARIGDTLYVADTNNHAIRAVDLKTREARTVKLTFPDER